MRIQFNSTFLMPEEVAALFFFFGLGAGGEDGFEGVGVEAGVVDFGGQGHGGWGKVLDLFEFEI